MSSEGTKQGRLHLKSGRQRSLERRHPWIFSGAVARADAPAGSGDTVTVHTADGRPLAVAAVSPASQIRARVWDFNPDTVVDGDFFRQRLAGAIARRAGLYAAGNGERLVYAEADGLPGVILDRYGDVAALQLLSAGAEAHRQPIVAAVAELLGPVSLFERSDAGVRRLEGLEPVRGPLLGPVPEPGYFDEYGLRLPVDVAGGHKTGAYLDQKHNRHRIGQLAAGRRVLNCFCYTGGFSLHALAGGASEVLSLDSSAPALAAAEQAVAVNGLPAARARWLRADVGQQLRTLGQAGERFDLIILDPPKFAPTAAHVRRASRSYKDIALFAFRLLAPGGLLASFSCSGGIDGALFAKITADAAIDAPVEAEILEHFQQAPDHPVPLAFPEAAYLKGLLLRRVA